MMETFLGTGSLSVVIGGVIIWYVQKKLKEIITKIEEAVGEEQLDAVKAEFEVLETRVNADMQSAKEEGRLGRKELWTELNATKNAMAELKGKVDARQ